MRRLTANLLLCWMLLLPCASALAISPPQALLPACCRVHGAHHCSMMAARQDHGPGWRGEACPFAKFSRAAILLAPYLPAASVHATQAARAAQSPSAEHAFLSAFLARLPGARAPPSIA